MIGDEVWRRLNGQRPNVSPNQAVVTSEEAVGSGSLGAGEVQGVERLLPGGREFAGTGANRFGKRNGMGRETEAPRDPKPPHGKRAAAVFEGVNWRRDQFGFASLDQTEHQAEGERLKPDARLLLVVERTIENAGVEVKAHSFRLG